MDTYIPPRVLGVLSKKTATFMLLFDLDNLEAFKNTIKLNLSISSLLSPVYGLAKIGCPAYWKCNLLMTPPAVCWSVGRSVSHDSKKGVKLQFHAPVGVQ